MSDMNVKFAITNNVMLQLLISFKPRIESHYKYLLRVANLNTWPP